MSLNFKLAYNSGFDYVDLFPRTSVDAIEFDKKATKQYSIQVNIPKSNDLLQTISIKTPLELSDKIVYMTLLYRKETDIYNYSTISQFSIENGTLKITRLYGGSLSDIQVLLTFVVNADTALKYSMVEITIPSTKEELQEIPYPFTLSQQFAPFYVELITKGVQAERDYASISQIEVTTDGIKIWRLNNVPSGSIKVLIRFEESEIDAQ